MRKNLFYGRKEGPHAFSRKLALIISIVFMFSLAAAAPLPGAANGDFYTPPTTITTADIIAESSGDMISYPHMGTPAFVEPGGVIMAELSAPAGYGAAGWSAWVENDLQYWNCAVGAVEYGANKIYLDTRAGYLIPVTLPADVSPELCTLVLKNGNKEWRSPMSVSVVPEFDTSFYTCGITDTHMGRYPGNGGNTIALMAKALTIAGVRFFSHTGDISLAPDCTRAEGIEWNLMGRVIEGRTPFILAVGNHEYDKFVEPSPSNNTGTREGNFSGDTQDRFFGMRSQIMMMGSFAAVKHDYGGYWLESEWLRDALSAKWNALTGASYRLIMQHTHTHPQTSPMFQASGPAHDPMPSPYPNLMIKGHDHQWKANQTSPFIVLSLGGEPWDKGESCLLNFNYSGGNWSCPQASGSFSESRNRYNFDPNETANTTKIAALRESFSVNNSGIAKNNSCTITNDLNFNFYDGRTRYLMAPGNYTVTGGEILSQYPSADGSKTIVLVRVNIPANGSAQTTITSDSGGAEATPYPGSMVNPVPNPGFEEASPLPVSSSSGIVSAKVTAPPIPITEGSASGAGAPCVFTYDSASSYYVKYSAADTGGSTNYIEIPLDGYTLEPGQKYGISYRVYSPDVGENTIVAKLIWGENVSSESMNYPLGSVNKYFYWKSPGIKASSGEVIKQIPTDAVVTTAKLRFYFQKLETAPMQVYLDDLYLAKVPGNNAVLLGTEPAAGSAVSGPLGSVTAYFETKMDMSSLTPANVTATGATVSSVVTAEDGMSAQIYFAAPVTAGTVTVNLNNNVRDVFARKLSPQAAVFTVGSISPEIVSAQPASGAAGVSPATDVRLTFNKPLNPAYVNAGNIYTADAEIASIALENGNKDIVITFRGLLQSLKTHTITLENLAGADGSTIAAPIIYTFTTAAAPEVEAVWPKDGEKKVYIKPTVNILFSLPVSIPEKESGVITINGGTDKIEQILADPDDARRVSVVLSSLSPFTRYTLKVEGAKTTYDAAFATFTSSFTTGDGRVNLFQNPGFEAKALGFDNLKNEISDEDPRSGAYSVKTENSTGEDWIIRFGGYEVGKTYGYSAYFKVTPQSPMEAGGIRLWIRTLYRDDNADYTYEVAVHPGVTKDGYTRITGKYTFPVSPGMPAAAANGAVWKFNPHGGIYYYMDDLEIFEISDTLGVSSEGDIYEGAEVENGASELTIAFNREMEQDLAADAISVDGVAAASVAPSEYSSSQFKVTLQSPLSQGPHTVSVAGAQDIYGDTANLEFSINAADPNFAVGSFKLFAGESDVTNGPLSGPAAITASAAQITNNTGDEAEIYLICALYKNERLVKTALSSATVAAGAISSEPLTAGMEIPDTSGGGYALKAFLWEGMAKLTPIKMISIN